MPTRSKAELELMQQQEQLILNANKSSLIFIGAQSGRRATPEKTQAGTLDKFLNKNEYKDAVLDPKTHLNAAWQVYLNEAFMKGAILSGRTIKLVTDFSFYEKFFNTSNALNNGTFYELLVLKENGFEFRKDSEGKILAVHTAAVPTTPILECFEDYELIFKAPKQDQRKLMEEKFKVYCDRALALIQVINKAKFVEKDSSFLESSSSSSVSALSVPQPIPERMAALNTEKPESFGIAASSQEPSHYEDTKDAPPVKKQKIKDEEIEKTEIHSELPSSSHGSRPGSPN